MRKNKILEISNLINKENPDLIFLQEVKNFALSDFKKSKTYQLDILQDNYNYIYRENCVYDNGHHGNAFLYKKSLNFEVLKITNENLSINNLEKRGLLHVKANIGNVRYDLLCTHLNLLSHHRKKQINSIKNVINKLDESSKIILAGDFNDFFNSIDKDFIKLNFKNEKFKTFPAINPVLFLDKIYLRNIENLDSYTIKNKQTMMLSDHLPLINIIKT